MRFQLLFACTTDVRKTILRELTHNNNVNVRFYKQQTFVLVKSDTAGPLILFQTDSTKSTYLFQTIKSTYLYIIWVTDNNYYYMLNINGILILKNKANTMSISLNSRDK